MKKKPPPVLQHQERLNKVDNLPPSTSNVAYAKEVIKMKIPEPRKLPSGNYFIQLRLGGESISITEPTAKECREKAALAKAEYINGKRAKQNQKSINLTLRQAIDNYIESRNNTLSPSTIKGYRMVQKHRFAKIMDKKLCEISDWQSVCNNEAKLVSAKTLKNAWGFILSVLTENGIPEPKVTLPQIVKNERAWLEPEQIPLFIKAIKGTPYEISALLALHSLRRSEIHALTWEKNIDLKNKRILVSGAMVANENHKFVHKKTNKNQTSNRYVPIMIDALHDALNAVENKKGPVVTLHPNTVCTGINKICNQNGLPCVGHHGLRHSFASLAYHLGMPELVAMRIGGWADFKTMKSIYTHLAEKDLSKYTKKMTSFYQNANKNANKKQRAV